MRMSCFMIVSPSPVYLREALVTERMGRYMNTKREASEPAIMRINGCSLFGESCSHQC